MATDNELLEKILWNLREIRKHLITPSEPSEPTEPTEPTDFVYPPQKDINDADTWTPYTQSDNTLPNYLEPFTNEEGLQITRVSDVDVFGTNDARLRHHYAKDQVWNADGTLIKLVARADTFILDGNTGVIVRQINLPDSNTLWSHTDPNKLYAVTGFNLVEVNATTGDRNTIKTFDGYVDISSGNGEGNLSIDDRYIGIQAKISSNNYDLIVYDILNDVTYKSNVGDAEPDWFSVCQSGKYAVAMYKTDGNAFNQGYKCYDIDMTNKRHIQSHSTHSDLGIDVNGDDVVVSFARSGGNTAEGNEYMRMTRLKDGLVTPLVKSDLGATLYGGHISCRNTKRHGWCYVTETNQSSNGDCKLVSVKLDGENNVCEVFGTHQAKDYLSYAQTPTGVPNQEGYKIMFNSHWDFAFNSSNGYSDASELQYVPSFIMKQQQD